MRAISRKTLVIAVATLVATLVALSAAYALLKPSQEPDGLFLYCGAGLRPAVDDLRREFTRRTGIPIQVSYAGSGCLLSMLSFARSGDLYMPGERYYTQQAQATGNITEDRIVARFVPVVMVRKGNPKHIGSLADLARADVRVGIGQPCAVACGRTAQKLLENAGLWDKVRQNIRERGAYTGTAVELTNAIALNALDAAINWDAMAYLARDKVEILVIPRRKNVEVEIPLAMLNWSKHKDTAQKFIDYVTSAEGRSAFEKHGYHTSSEPYRLPYYGEHTLE